MIISHDNQITDPFRSKRHRGLFIMDFDGTLLRSDRTFANLDLNALKRLGDQGVVRAIATGRSLYSFNTVAVSNLPVDFVIFSTGAGVFQHPGGQIVRKVSLEPKEVERACVVLKAAKLDFMVHRTIPDNHSFAYFQSKGGNADFERRLSLYDQFAFPLVESSGGFGPATQLLAIVPPQGAKPVLENIRNELSDFNVIQTTSPLDGKSTWIEIFPTAVSKSLAAAWLAQELGIDKGLIVAVGNDYNDLDLLEWSAMGYVVANAPADLKTRFPAVASNNHSGVAEAAERWLAKKMADSS
jgi:HAD superfamily hydrolase (TIGR01484 family)